jgi:TetR/AcrR family transcriptional regulator, transcriptional repressor for nem operon
MHSALGHARARGELGPDTDLDAAADLLALLAYGVNLRSRAGADPRELRRTVGAGIAGIGGSAG